MSGLIRIQTVSNPDGRIQRDKYGTIIKCEGIKKAILEHPKADQNAPFNYVINFSTTYTVLLANDLLL